MLPQSFFVFIFLTEYGNVVELRINRNSNPRLPFFGFVVFDEPGPVQYILKIRTQKVKI